MGKNRRIALSACAAAATVLGTVAAASAAPSTTTAVAEAHPPSTGVVSAEAPAAAIDAAAAAAYRSAVLDDDPVAYWRLGERGGSTIYDQVADLDGTYQGGVQLGSDGAFADNTSVTFDGSSGAARIPHAQALGLGNAMTIEAWVRPARSATQTVARKDGQYLLRLGENGALTFRLWKGGVPQEVSTGAGAVAPGTWTHVAGRWNGTNMDVYVDGRKVATSALRRPADSATTALVLGSSSERYDWFDGRIDELAVYATAVPTQRIAAHVEARSGGATSDLVPPAPRLLTPSAGSAMHQQVSVGGSAGTRPGDRSTVTVSAYSGTTTAGSPVSSATTTRFDGMFSVTLPATLAPGTYTVVAEQRDDAGNVGRSNTSTFTVRAADPSLLAAGDIAACDRPGSEQTARILDRTPGQVQTLGDNAYLSGTAAELSNCYSPTWGRHLARTRAAAGNHDYYTASGAPFYAYFGAAAGPEGKGYYSYELGSWHVVVLNANCSSVGGCGAGSVQERWLRADLAAHPRACTLAIVPSPLFSSGDKHGNTPRMRAFWDALYDHGADVVLSADDHVYERFSRQTPAGVASSRGIREFVVGTGGSWHYGFDTPQPNSQVREADTFGVLRLDLHESSYDWEFLPEAGSTFTDSGSTSCS